jgi:hypothetical protein
VRQQATGTSTAARYRFYQPDIISYLFLSLSLPRSELQQAAQQSTEDCEAAQRAMAALYSALTLVDIYPSFGAELQSCANCVRGFSASFGAHVLSTELSGTAALPEIRPSEAQQPPRVSVVLPAGVQSLLALPGEILPPRYYTRKWRE